MVLFVICIHNYYYINGLRMNTAQFSAHPDERELILMEGAPVAVMGSEEILIDNVHTRDSYWDSFNGKKITIIYMFQAVGFD